MQENQNYDIERGSFVIAASTADKIFTDDTINYNILREEFGKMPNGTKNPSIKQKYEPKNGFMRVYMQCRNKECNTRFKLTYKKPTEKGQEVVVSVFTNREWGEETCCDELLQPQFRGEIRNEIKKKLETKSVQHQKREMAAAAKPDEAIPHQKQLENMKHEMRKGYDLHDNPKVDLVMRMAKNEYPCLREVSFYKNEEDVESFRVILLWDEAIDLLEQYIKNPEPRLKRLLLDATGKVTEKLHAKASLHHVLLLPYPKDNGVCFLVPIAEMITDDGTARNISHFLHFIAARVTNFHKIHQIGTDDSAANINAILSLTPGMNVTQYMSKSFAIFEGKKTDKTFFDKTVEPTLCISHVIRNWDLDLKREYGREYELKDVRRKIRGALSLLTEAKPKLLHHYIQALFQIIGSPTLNDLVRESLKCFENGAASQEYSEGDYLRNDEEYEEDVIPKNLPQYKRSPFWRKYRLILVAIRELSLKSDPPNPFYNEKFSEKILNRYIAYLPFWTRIISSIYDEKSVRGNNARIERHFRDLKDACDSDRERINRLGRIKIGRYIWNRNKTVLTDFIFIRAPKRKTQTRRKKSDPMREEEKWRKGRRSKPTDVPVNKQLLATPNS